MSAARVLFLRLDGTDCPAEERPARFTFVCVGHNKDKPRALYEHSPTMCANLLIAEGPHSFPHGIKRDPQAQNGGSPQWGWNGDRKTPTFHPSINCEKHCGWHGYIESGRCVNTAKQDEPEPR